MKSVIEGLRQIGLVLALFASQPSLAHAHPLVLDDILQMQEFGEVAIDPHGRRLTYEIIGPYAEMSDFGIDDRRYGGRIVVIDLTRPRHPSIEIARGLGTWIGALSPTGDRLAYYWRTEGQVRLSVHDFATGQTTDLDVNPVVDFNQTVPIWLSEREIAVSALPDGEGSPRVAFRSDSVRILERQWHRAWANEGPTADVLTSRPARAWREGHLVATDLQSGAARILADGRFASLTISADGQWLAAARQAERLTVDRHRTSSVLANGFRFEPVLIEISSGRLQSLCDRCEVTGIESFTWDANSEHVAFFSHAASAPWELGMFQMWDLRTQRSREVSLSGLNPVSQRERGNQPLPERAVPAFDGLMVYARPSTTPDTSRVNTRADWFLVRDDLPLENLTASLSHPEPRPIYASSCGVIVSAAAGFWTIQPGGHPQPLSSCDDTNVPSAVQLNQDAGQTIVSFGGRHVSMRLRGTASMTASSREAGLTAMIAASRYGTELVLLNHNAARVYSRRINAHLEAVQPAQEMRIEHEFRGQHLTSCVQLPENWRRGRLVPVIISLYPNKRDCSRAWQRGYIDQYAVELLTGMGYAVLHLSAPTALLRENDNPVANWGALADSAIDALVDDGIADRHRVGIFGFSQGAISALAAIGQSDYSAAVAFNGASDFLSHYGQLGMARQVMSTEIFSIGQSVRYETGDYTTFGALPWEQPDQYWRASPIANVEHVQTPLLLMHGDLDHNFPMSQTDEYFVALYRLGREVEYVRYWGEGHGNTSPENIRDAWRRIRCWYDSHLDMRAVGSSECPSG